ncbi:MAG: DUF2723 domain-containing protein [Pseudomonadales bacterium]|nr:DUF2723 domain-containing protein [Pseudomonadales bacterium]
MSKTLRVVDGALVFGLTLLFYTLTMPRAITLEDAGLFQMVCHMGGIGHPPGYPLFTMLCQPLMFFPHVINGNLISALFAGLTVIFLYLICLRMTGDRVFAIVAALAYGFSNTFWSQAIIIEVYTLATLLFVVCWWFLQSLAEQPRLRSWLLFTLFFGLGLSNHWPLLLLSTPALLAMLWPLRNWLFNELKSPRFWVFSSLCFLVGLAPYVTILLNDNPEIAVFGAVDSPSELVRYVSRSAYSDDHPSAGVYDKLQYGGWLLGVGLSEFGVVGTPVLIAGLIVGFGRLPRNVNLALWLMYLGSTFMLVMLLDFEYRHYFRAVFRPYPVIACIPLAIWFALGVHLMVDFVSRYARWTRYLIPSVAVVLVLVSNFNDNNRSESTLARDYGESVLNSLPPNAVLFTKGDNQTGVLGYLHHVRGLRPDVELRDWENLVFANRLASPRAGEDRRREEILQFVQTTDRPVFLLDPLLTPTINYGAYFGLASGNAYAFEPALERYLDLLLILYLGDYITDGHEQHFAFNMLIRYARQYLGYAHHSGYESLDETRRARIALLQQTFPGRIVTLEVALDNGGGVAQKQKLLSLVDEAREGIPEFATPPSRAMFYNLAARLHLLPPVDREEAKRFYRLSIESWPTSDNPGICPLIGLYRQSEDQREVERWRANFPEKNC